jgi:uncharacterized FAD-dependent dehydrogenase
VTVDQAIVQYIASRRTWYLVPLKTDTLFYPSQGMHASKIALEYQPFAAGFRIEHPQALLDVLQYGESLAGFASRGKGKLPVADYRLAHTCVGTAATDGSGGKHLAATDGDKMSKTGTTRGERACYSFCMCPGGQIVPTSTDPNYLCVNGMSFSKRYGLHVAFTKSKASLFYL